LHAEVASACLILVIVGRVGVSDTSNSWSRRRV
jgi:hypothetical protein